MTPNDDGAVASCTLGEVLQMPVVRQGLPQVLGGETRLSRAVRWTHILELSDPSHLLRGGELVLTTGRGMADDVRGQRRWLQALAEQNAAALIIEIGLTYAQRVPRSIVTACRDLELPLIALQRRVSFVELTEAIQSAILHRDVTLVRYAEVVEDRVVDMLLEEQDMSVVVTALARELGVPVVLEGPGRETLCSAAGGWDEDLMLRALRDFLQYEQHGNTTDAVIVETIDRDGGRLIALGIDAPLDDFQRVAFRRAARTVALRRFSSKDQRRTRSLSRGLLLADLAAGRVPPAVAAERARLLGFTPARGRLVPLAARRGQASGAYAVDAGWSTMLSALRDGFKAAGLSSLFGVDGATLLGMVDTMDDADMRETLADVFYAIAGRADLASARLILVLGRPMTGWATAGEALARAVRRVGAAETLPVRRWHDAHASDVVDLLHSIRDTPALRSFALDQLGPLLRDDVRRAPLLLKTLRALVDSGGRKAAAARALHLDRASLYPRLAQIERLLGVDLDDPRTLMSLHVALEALDLLRGDEAGLSHRVSYSPPVLPTRRGQNGG